MRQFDLKEWLDNKDMTLVTRDGKPVRIICWEAPNKAFPVVGFIEGSFSCYSWDPFGYYTTCHIKHKYDLFFKCDKPGRFTEFERAFIEYSCHTEPEYLSEEFLKNKLENAKKLYEIAKREIDTGFEPKFTYSEKDYSELGNKLIEFRNNTPLFSVSYREGEGRRAITHYEKEITEIVKRQLCEEEKRTKENESDDIPVSALVPKFKPGEWIAADGTDVNTDINEDYRIVRIVKAENGYYTIESHKGFVGCNSFDAWESEYHPWTIDDAREGDVLVSDQGSLFVYSGKKSERKSEKGGRPFAYCGVIDNAFVECPSTVPCTCREVNPATYEQRIEMESKMREAGYEWNPAFTRPVRILQEEQNTTKATYAPQWTKEDETYYSRISECIEQDTETSAEEHALLEWLRQKTKTAVFRRQGGWTDEDEKIAEKIYDCADFLLLKDSGVSEDRFAEWFDFLKLRLQRPVTGEHAPHDPDENIRYDMCFSDAQQYLSDRGFDIPWNDCDVFVDGRYITQSVANILAWADDNGKTGWKPTERDIKDLERCAELVKEKMGVGYHRLQVLIDELKALVEK